MVLLIHMDESKPYIVQVFKVSVRRKERCTACVSRRGNPEIILLSSL